MGESPYTFMELRDIPGFGGHYVVSPDGDIYRVWKKGYKLIHPKVTRCGYIYAQLHVDGKKKGIMVHEFTAYLIWRITYTIHVKTSMYVHRKMELFLISMKVNLLGMMREYQKILCITMQDGLIWNSEKRRILNK